MVAIPVIPALGRLRQEDHEFQASLEYIVRSYLKTPKKEKKDRAGQGRDYDFLLLHISKCPAVHMIHF
jgi:hypothetical protein